MNWFLQWYHHICIAQFEGRLEDFFNPKNSCRPQCLLWYAITPPYPFRHSLNTYCQAPHGILITFRYAELHTYHYKNESACWRSQERKINRYDLVLWQKPLYRQKSQKSKAKKTPRTRSITKRFRSRDHSSSTGVVNLVYGPNFPTPLQQPCNQKDTNLLINLLI